MSLNKYYKEELRFLREMGKEFAEQNPTLSDFFTPGVDPDVDRILEGFAFLTGKIRQKLDDEFPEIIQGLLQLLWPHYLRAIPAATIIQFEPIAGMIKNVQTIPAGVSLDSISIDGVRCRFRTCYDLELLPFNLTDVHYTIPTGQLPRISLRLTPMGNIQLHQLTLNHLMIHLFGQPSYWLYLWLSRYVKNVSIVYKPKTKPDQDLPETRIALYPDCIEPVGFSKNEALLPYPLQSFEGYRLVQEYFAFPAKFFFFRIYGLNQINFKEVENDIEIIVEFSRPLPDSIRLNQEHIRLNCVPAINLFDMDADPIRVEHNKAEYRLRPSVSNPTYYQIYSVNKVNGKTQGSAKEQDYESFYSFRHDLKGGHDKIYYSSHLRENIKSQIMDTYLSFVNSTQTAIIPPSETVDVRTTCINALLPIKLKVGDIREYTDTSPEFATFSNITNVTSEIMHPFGSEVYWKLLSHISVNYMSLADAESLKAILALYNFQSKYDQQKSRGNELRIHGIQRVLSDSIIKMIQGAPVRGLAIKVFFDEKNFDNEGDMFLFASILNEFFSLYASLNSFTTLTAIGIHRKEEYKWPLKLGKKKIL
jgi:type VI secretion system protein ImpG